MARLCRIRSTASADSSTDAPRATATTSGIRRGASPIVTFGPTSIAVMWFTQRYDLAARPTEQSAFRPRPRSRRTRSVYVARIPARALPSEKPPSDVDASRFFGHAHGCLLRGSAALGRLNQVPMAEDPDEPPLLHDREPPDLQYSHE